MSSATLSSHSSVKPSPVMAAGWQLISSAVWNPLQQKKWLACSICEVTTYLPREQLLLGDQFSSIVASHVILEDFCGDWWQHLVIMVLTNGGVGKRKLTTNQKRMHDVMLKFRKSFLLMMAYTLHGCKQLSKTLTWERECLPLPQCVVLHRVGHGRHLCAQHPHYMRQGHHASCN